jgi:hypothetical protein
MPLMVGFAEMKEILCFLGSTNTYKSEPNFSATSTRVALLHYELHYFMQNVQNGF